MRLPPNHRGTERRLEMPMTPMIDVVFLLLIFFVCTASFQAPDELLPAHLLSSGTVPMEALDPQIEELEQVVVKIHFDDGGHVRWKVNDRACAAMDEVRQVLTAVATVRNDLPVVLDVGGDIPVSNLVEVWDACRLVGFLKIQFAAMVTPA